MNKVQIYLMIAFLLNHIHNLHLDTGGRLKSVIYLNNSSNFVLKLSPRKSAAIIFPF